MNRFFTKGIISLLLLFIAGNVLSQNIGDYGSLRNGNWSDDSDWGVWNGAAFVTNGTYPGQNGGVTAVYIGTGHRMTLDLSPANSIGEIRFMANNNSRSQVNLNGYELVVTRGIYFTQPLGDNDQRFLVNDGTLTCALIDMIDSGSDGADLELRIGTGTVNVSGDITMRGSATRSFIYFSDNGNLNIGGSISGGRLTRDTNGSYVRNGTVRFNGTSGTQTIDSQYFNNVIFEGAANKVLTGQMLVYANVTVNSNLYCGANTIVESRSNRTTTFNLNNGTTLGVGSSDGITSAGNASGNVQLDNRNYDTGANYIYNAAGAQEPGNGLPSTVNQLSIEFPGILNISNPMTISSNLNLLSGSINIGANDLILEDGATITGAFDNDHMIVVDGATLTKQSSILSDFNMTYPLGTYNVTGDVYEYTPMVVSNLTGGITGTAELAVNLVNDNAPNANAIDLLRYWEVTETNFTSVNGDVTFTYMDGDIGGDEANYEFKYATSTAATSWSDPANASINTGTNVLSSTGTSTLQGVWSAQEPIVAWYTLKSGDWNDPSIWTNDPSGALPLVGNTYYPQAATDNVVIKSGREVTMNLNGVTCNYLTIEGELKLGTSSGHTFSKIFGDGRVYMEADNFPAGDATHFVTKNQGEGTIIYQGNAYSISNAHTFFDVEIELTNAGSQITLLADLTINNNLTLKTGNLRINDDTQTNVLNVAVTGNLDVQGNASLTVGQGNTRGGYAIGGTMPGVGQYHNIFHQLVVSGDLINRGTVRLTNEAAPRYNQFTSLGAVTLRMQGAANNSMSLYGTTDLYNLLIEKGVDKTYVLELYADNQNYFRLFGPNNVGRRESSPFSSSNPEVRKALWIHQGTLKLTGSIHIPSLSEGTSSGTSGGNGDYAIGEFGKMIIAGANVEVYSTAEAQSQIPGFETTAIGVVSGGSHSAMSLFGDFQIDDGVFNTRNSYGFVYWASANPLIEINGGTVTVSRLYQVGSGPVSFMQTGGLLSVTASHFDLSSEDAVFQMSGGEIEMRTGDFIIGSKEGNYSVTGGTLRFELNSDRTLNSTANLYNLIINKRSGSDRELILSLPLVALNDVTVNNGAFLNHQGRNVTIGRNFTIADGAYDHGYSTTNNTLTFNGTEDATFYIGHPTVDGYELPINNLTINKQAGKKLTLQSSPEKTATHLEAISSSAYFARIIQVKNDLRVESGILDQGDHAIRMYGPLFVGATGVCGIYEHGITHKDALVMIKDVESITTEAGAELGNIKMNPSTATKIFDLTSDVVIKRISYHHGRMNLGTYNLKVDYIHKGGKLTPYEVSDGRESDEMFIIDGNASDGGLSLLIHSIDTYAFPIGISGKYTPAELKVNSWANNGYVTIRPVQGELKTTDLSGGNLLDYYWRVDHSDFTTLPTVQYAFTYNDADDLANDEANFYPGKVLDENPYTRSYENNLGNVDTGNNIITFNDYRTTSGGSEVSDTRAGFTLENANYSAGVANRFTGAVRVFYTKYRNADAYQAKWDQNSSWTFGINASYDKHDSRQAEAGDIPGNGDVAVIGWIPWNDAGSLSGSYGLPHGVCVDSGDDITCAEIVFDQMTDDSGNPVPRAYRYNFQFRPAVCINGSGKLSAEMIRGEGMFWNRHSDPDMSTMDLGEFAVNDSSYVLYEFSDPGAGGVRDLNNTSDKLPNLLVASPGWGGYDRDIRFTKNIVTNGNLEILGDANVLLSNGVDGDLNIGRNLVMFSRGSSGGGAELAFQNSGTERTVTIAGDIRLENANNQIRVRSADGSALDHKLYVSGNITQTASGNGLDLWTSNTSDRVTLYLEGSDNMTFDVEAASAVPDLYRIIMNKGVDQSVTANFISDFNLNGLANGTSGSKALDLQNGTLVLNNSDIDINLTTGGESFNIPSTAAIVLQNGAMVNATGNSGIYLDGTLQVDNGTVNMAGGDNSIIYSASGNARLSIADGSITVGGQIRRGTITDVGILSFSQTGGVVRVGTNSASTSNRGVFEVLGTGSHFEHTGGTLSIENAQTSASVAALLLEPATSNVGASSTIQIGGASTGASQTIGVNSSVALSNLLVDNSSGNNPIAQQVVRSLTLNGGLQINTNTQFDAVGLDLFIGGDLTANGTFIPNGNSTYLNGSSTQTIYGDVNFHNLEKSGVQELVLDAGGVNLDIDNNLNFTGGTLTANANEVQVQRNVTFDGTQVITGGNGLILNGTIAQTLSGSGTFDVLTINNANGVDVPLGNQLSINTSLRLQSGVFNIDKNLLILNAGSTIEEVSPFSASNMIQTNISFTDNGVRKYFNTMPKTFIYPMGSGGKYTPVSIRIDSNTSPTGCITVKAADEYHPSVLDPTNVLDYHWILKSENITGFTGEIRMNYDPNDINVSGGNTINNYISARLLADGSGKWNKPFGTIDQANDELVYTYGTAITSAEISGDYTAGVDPAIPDQVPSYISIKDGPWNDAATWDTYPTAGEGVPAGGPRGAIVIVGTGTNVTVTADAISAYQTTINGTLSLGTTAAHRLGDVTGTGTLSAESGVMPAGVYDSFVSASGGTLEYAGNTDYSVLGDLTSVNNLSFTGTSQRRLPNHNLTILGNLNLNGASLINDNDKDIILKKDLTFDGGTFDSGDNGAKVIFSGSSIQTIDGSSSFTGANGIDHFKIDNANGVTVKIDVDIDNYLNLANGIIFNTGNNLVVKSNLASAIIGGGASSYIQGPLTKLINNGDSFTFPIGDADRLGDVQITNTQTIGADYWSAEYFNNSPANESKDPTSVAGDVQFVSQNEYWRIQGPAGSQSKVTLRWDALSGVTPDANFRVVDWRNTSDWNEVAISTPVGNNTAGTVQTASLNAFNHFAGEGNYYTFGSINIPAYTWMGGSTTGNWFDTANWSGGTLPAAGTNIVLNNTGLAPFVPDDARVAQVNDLTINHTSGLTVQPGGQLTVNGNLQTNGRLYIENTNGKPSSVITHGTVTGDVSIKWTFDNLQWWLIGHAIPNPVMASYDALLPGNDYAIYDYQDPASMTRISKTAFDFSAESEIRGYIVKVKNAGAQVTHVGALNTNAVYSKNLQTAWQVIANPYNAYYKLPKENRSGADFENTSGTAYVTVSTSNDDKTFETFNTITGIASPETFTNGIIAPSQAFYLETETGKDGQPVYMRAAHCVHDVNKVELKSTPNKETDVLRVKLSNQKLTDEAVVALRDNGTSGYSRLDSKQRFQSSNAYSYIYSVAEETPLVINVLPFGKSQFEVELGMRPKAGKHTMKISGLNTLSEEYVITLEDKNKPEQENVVMDANTTYEFEVDEAVAESEEPVDSRFVLHFSKVDVSTDIDDLKDKDVKDNDSDISVRIQNNSTLVANCNWKEEKQIALYTIEGRQLLREQFIGDSYQKIINLKSGIYIVKIVSKNNSYEQKVFVK